MEPSDEDRALLQTILESPDAIVELERSADQLFLLAIDNCVHRFFSSLGTNAAVLFPKSIRG